MLPPANPRKIADIDVDNRRVLVRIDLHHAAKSEGEVRLAALRRTCETLRVLLDRGARVIAAAHLEQASKSLANIGGYLAQVLGTEIRLPDEVVGDSVTKLVTDTRAGQVVLLENLYQHAGESQSQPDFARALASLCDAYVNDAVSASRVPGASTSEIPGKVPEHQCAAGENLFAVARSLVQGRDKSGPTVYFVDVPDTEEILRALSSLAGALKSGDTLYLSGLGGIAISQAIALPNSRPRAWEQEAKTLLAKARARDAVVVFPTDGRWRTKEGQNALVPAESLAEHGEQGLGPSSIAALERQLQAAGRAIWIDLHELSAGNCKLRAADTQIAQLLARKPIERLAGGGRPLLALDGQLRERDFAGSLDALAILELASGHVSPGIEALVRANTRVVAPPQG